MKKRALAAVFAVLLAVSLSIPAGTIALNDDLSEEDITNIGDDHDLDSADAISQFNSEGVTSAELARLDMEVTIAEKKSDIGLEDQLLPSSIRNDFIRLQYNEEADRTVRILIPDDYFTPYPRERVSTVTGDADVEIKPIRGGDYMEIIARFHGEDDVVIPIQWDSQISYQAIERVDDRLDNSIGITLRDDDAEWQYVDSDALTEGPGYSIGESAGDVTVQYDATPDQPEETWINAPKGETFSDDIYYYQRDSEDGTAYIVAKTDNPPAIRYNVDSSLGDRLRGDLRDIGQIPERIEEFLR